MPFISSIFTRTQTANKVNDPFAYLNSTSIKSGDDNIEQLPLNPTKSGKADNTNEQCETITEKGSNLDEINRSQYLKPFDNSLSKKKAPSLSDIAGKFYIRLRLFSILNLRIKEIFYLKKKT